MRNFEQELKLQLTEREYLLISNLTTEQPKEQTNYYFDSVLQDSMVRLREKNGVFVLCYKQKVSTDDFVAVNEEYECEVENCIAQDMLDKGVSADFINKILGTNIAQKDLCFIGELVTYRTTFVLQDWKIELDKNSYLGVVDYELECENNLVENLEKLKDFLYYNYGISAHSSISKYKRFIAQKQKLENDSKKQ